MRRGSVGRCAARSWPAAGARTRGWRRSTARRCGGVRARLRARDRLRAPHPDPPGRLPGLSLAPLLGRPRPARADVWETTAGRHATVFTHVVDRRASAGDLFIQYWLYYPDSTYLGPAYVAHR